MKTLSTTLMVLLSVVLLSAVSLKAQSNQYKNITPNSIKTLAEGIQSENTGLKKSSIYLAGIYKIDEVVNVLTDELKKENEPNTRVLIALALYNIGDPEGMKAVKDLSVNSENTNVKRMSTAIYRAYSDLSETISKR